MEDLALGPHQGMEWQQPIKHVLIKAQLRFALAPQPALKTPPTRFTDLRRLLHGCLFPATLINASIKRLLHGSTAVRIIRLMVLELSSAFVPGRSRCLGA